MDEETELLEKVERVVGVSLEEYFAKLDKSVQLWAGIVSRNEFWVEAKKRLPDWKEEYFRASDGAELLADINQVLPEFQAKTRDSIREKFFRVAKEEGGKFKFEKIWPDCKSLIPDIHDLVRTRIQCKWQDGVEFLSEKLIALANELHVYETDRTHGGVEGYFAHHLYFMERQREFRLRDRPGEKPPYVDICCEVQIATVVQTVIWEASHPVYGLYRGRRSEPREWQWNSDDPRFIPNQLGHLTHLADGLLVHHRKNLAREVKRQSLLKLLTTLRTFFE